MRSRLPDQPGQPGSYEEVLRFRAVSFVSLPRGRRLFPHQKFNKMFCKQIQGMKGKGEGFLIYV